ncbi:MAG: cobalamin-binding protein [Candidatus Bathyarchaeota archaeon]|nr:cobalamin-binding protein [Candidatus Termiticorpusculum sp.]MCL1971279.1 cobalamin-binding protein [Candidatus Termiticorpusculum sp.]
MQKKILYLVTALVIAIVLVSAIVVYTNPQITSDGKPITVVDDNGTEVTINSVPERIVSLAPGSTEILFAVGAGDQVVGVTDYCDYPPKLTEQIANGKTSSIGNYWMPSIEPIIALEPNLVIASGGGASDEVATKLRNLGYTVIVLNPQTVNNVLDNINLVGKASGHTKEAATLVDSLQKRIDAIENKIVGITDKPKIYVEVSDNPLMSVGPKSFISDLITLVGGVNIFADADVTTPTVSSEVVIGKNPDIIISTWASVDNFSKRAGWSSISAVANNKIYDVSKENIYQRPGPRFIDALEDLSKVLYPNIFA